MYMYMYHFSGHKVKIDLVAKVDIEHCIGNPIYSIIIIRNKTKGSDCFTPLYSTLVAPLTTAIGVAKSAGEIIAPGVFFLTLYKIHTQLKYTFMSKGESLLHEHLPLFVLIHYQQQKQH